MYKKYPFTSAGFKDLLTNLYALPDAELKVEANKLLLNFNEWVIAHFELSESQIVYLTNLSDQTTAFTAAATSFAVKNRLPVLLEKDPDAIRGEVFKILKTQNKLSITEGEDETVAGGEVIIKIEFITSSGGH